MSSIESNYILRQELAKIKIRKTPNKYKRFLKWIWYLISFPFIWIFINIRDWRTAIIFIIVFLCVSSEVWIPYLIAFICWTNVNIRISMLSLGSACWLFWAGPGTPFMVICISITILVRSLFNKLRGIY